MFKIRLWFYWMVAGVVLIGTIVWLSCWGTQVSQDWATLQQNPTDASKKKFDASLEVVKAIVGGIGTVATIGGGFFVLWNIRLTQTRLITERFSKAVEQLGSDKIEVRLGGIYALERIAQDSDRDHWTIMEVLTSFIQAKASMKRIPEERIRARADEIQQKGSGGTDKQNRDSAIRELISEPITKDIQAALTVIGRRRHKKDPPDKVLDLSEANLSEANLNSAKFNGADLYRANLNDAFLKGAFLNGAKLSLARLSCADLSLTKLNGADLSYTDLSYTDLSDADLRHSNLNSANLNGADLKNANFKDVDLSQTEGLTAEQMKVAKLCQTKLPQGVTLDSNL